MTVIVGLIALFLWVAQEHGPFVAFAVVALATSLLAALLFTIALTRGDKPARPMRPAAVASATSRSAASPPDFASLAAAITRGLTDKTASATHEAVDTAADLVRKGSRETMLATLAVAVVVGLVIGRRT